MVALGRFILLRIGGIDAVNGRALEKGIAVHFRRAQGRCGIRREVRRTGAGGENNYPALFEMPNGATAHEGLANGVHLDGRLHAGIDALLFQSVLHSQRIHHRGQHAHVIGAGALHVARRLGQPAEDIAAADHQTQLNTETRNRRDLSRHSLDGIHVDAETLIAHQHFAGHFQQDTLVSQRRCGRWYRSL